MKIQYCSDLHLEFQENANFLKRNPIEPTGEILILAGDIIPFKVMNRANDFFQFTSDHFQYTYWVPGNHEYYSSDASERSGSLNEKIKSNVLLLNNTAIEHKDIKLIFSTLWSKIREIDRWEIERGINDFHVIKFKGKCLSSAQFNNLHEESLKFLKSELDHNGTAKQIVVTHHVPTLLNYPKQYLGGVLNQAFAVELFDLIDETQPDCWVYGHHHQNTPDFAIGKTQMLTNQLGYVSYNEHENFKQDKNFVI